MAKSAQIRFTVRVSDRTEVTATKDEISMGMKIYAYPEISKPIIKNETYLRSAIAQALGTALFNKREKTGLKGWK